MWSYVTGAVSNMSADITSCCRRKATWSPAPSSGTTVEIMTCYMPSEDMQTSGDILEICLLKAEVSFQGYASLFSRLLLRTPRAYSMYVSLFCSVFIDSFDFIEARSFARSGRVYRARDRPSPRKYAIDSQKKAWKVYLRVMRKAKPSRKRPHSR